MVALQERVEEHVASFFGLPLPMTVRLTSPLTDSELLAFSVRHKPYRIERNSDGELEIMTPVGGKGSRGESFLIRNLDLWADSSGGASFSSQGGFNLPDGSTRSADAAWVGQERWNSLSDEQQSSFPPLCPDFVIELVSRTDLRAKVEEKMAMWMANGAGLAWMIDPAAGEVLVYRPGASAERLDRPAWVEADAVVRGFRLETARFWEKR